MGAPDGSGAGNRILNNLVHDVTDSSVIDAGIPGYGYGGHGIFLDHKSAGVDVQNNVVFQVADSTIAMSEGPAPGYPGNTFRNNILASARKSIFKFPSPWSPEGCGEKQLRVSFASNIFQFDRNDAALIQGCSYSCGLGYDKFENFQGNLYWRAGSRTFQVMTRPPVDPARCRQSADQAEMTFLSFAQWQGLKEDVTGTASVDPGFGKWDPLESTCRHASLSIL